MDKDLYGNKTYTPEDLKQMDDQEVIEAGYCPSCADEGVKAQLIQGSGCETCIRCAWSPCKVG